MNRAAARWHGIWLAAAALLAGGCSSLVSSITADLAEDLSTAILDNPDVATVRDGAPAYLILIDGLLARSPDDIALLQQAAQLNSAYAAAFVTEPERARLLQDKALLLAEKSVCLGLTDGCELRTRDFADFEAWVAKRSAKDVPLLYGLGSSWAGWLQANSDDFVAIAELGRVKLLMARVAELDSAYDHGGPQLYLAVFETLLPPALGGRPEVGRAHFEEALRLGGGEYLMTKVFYAEQYARMVFDRELHDRLLQEVVGASTSVPGLTLINRVAQQRAIQLLESADDYF
jgi:hypothetical protein